MPHVPRDARSEKEGSIMFVGICIAVMVALATPMVWVWMADRIKRRKMDPFRKFRDVERGKKHGDASPPPYGCRPVVDSIWARQEKYKTARPARAITADQILGIDKTSYLRRIVPQKGSSQLLTVAPAHLGWARQRITPAGNEEQCISPWDAEHAPNPVIFPWLQKRGLGPSTSRDAGSGQSLQVMTITSSSTRPTWSSSEGTTRVSADDTFLDSPTEYTSSSRNSEKSCELSDAGLEEGTVSAQPHDANTSALKQPIETPSSLQWTAEYAPQPQAPSTLSLPALPLGLCTQGGLEEARAQCTQGIMYDSAKEVYAKRQF
ncbi:uncharacterized protein SETTUDRAFT_33460 [Exserohilum turcica Et28A]|uniref:Uncharacterized protein n=1 Tax=Exserohilum turcicum (strain 28A) TaxID=671987 RepID=R0K499_EXST2|nr:uncharacterized protein SETTUDRAFT_33460 [Exserohilum turcica Et28A]EOA83137.1 hypothetical protein SETTUDRAFT_33460 [Exserohilum turcica Et28A]